MPPYWSDRKPRRAPTLWARLVCGLYHRFATRRLYVLASLVRRTRQPPLRTTFPRGFQLYTPEPGRLGAYALFGRAEIPPDHYLERLGPDGRAYAPTDSLGQRLRQ